MIAYTSIETKIGTLFLASSKKGICKIGLPRKKTSTNLDWLKNHFPDDEIVEDKKYLSKLTGELKQYFSGQLKNFESPIDLQISPFRKKALLAVSEIPCGQTASYKEIAEKINNPKAVRAVGSANANNPIPILIPCHRVIAQNGSMGGYGGGLIMKRKLLELEGAI